MRLAVLCSGGKDSLYAAFLAKKMGHEIAALVSMQSSNLDSFLFHTPSIEKVRVQADVMQVPLIVGNTKGIEEEEIFDLSFCLHEAKQKFGVQGVVSGAVESAYQAARFQRACLELDLEMFNPLWQMNQISLIESLISDGFEAIVVGVAAYPLDDSWLGRCIDEKFLSEVCNLQSRYGINPAGEGGEFESFVLNCPLFIRPLEVVDGKKSGSKNAWRLEVSVV